MAKNRWFGSFFNLTSNSINFKFGQFSPTYKGYSLTVWPQIADLDQFSICNQNQSISNLVIFHQNTKAIALLCGQKSLIWITFQSAINLNQLWIRSFVTKIRWFGSLINLQSKSINFKFGHFSPKNQGYSLLYGQTSLIWITFQSVWPQIADLDHFSICNQNQSISHLVIFHQNTKAIALLFGQTSLIWITYQSAIKINQFQIWSFFTKKPRL